MKTLLRWRTVAVLAALVFGGSSALADLEVSVGFSIHAKADFDGPLASLGTWVDAGPYGHCWRPRGVAADWRPYCNGDWEYTDCGWYWNSEEPWSWACYHYGNWVDDPNYGWLWIPDIDWAPAWVSWRTGGGYIGWAPLPPRRVGFGIGINIGAPAFVFVQGSHFNEHLSRSTVIVNNTTIINKTTIVNNSIRTENRTIEGAGSRRVNVNVGPPVADIQRATGHQLRPVPVRDVVARTPAPRITPQPSRPGEATQPEQLRQREQSTRPEQNRSTEQNRPPDQTRQEQQQRQQQLLRDQQRPNNQRDQREPVRTTAPRQATPTPAPERDRQLQQQQQRQQEERRNLTQPRETQPPQHQVAPTERPKQPAQQPPAIPNEQAPPAHQVTPSPEPRQPAAPPREQAPPQHEVTPQPQQRQPAPPSNPGQEQRRRDEKQPGQN